MALQVWLPLNKGYDNQGLYGNISPNILGTTSIIDGGPIGKCLSAGNGSAVANGVQYPTNLVDILAGCNFSASVWVKPLGTHPNYEGVIMSSGNWNTKQWAFGVSQDNTKVDLFGNSYRIYVNCEVPVGKWTHLVSTYDSEKIGRLYKNGEYVGSVDFKSYDSYPISSSTNIFTVGREDYAGGYFSFNGNIADLRVYDHVLSTKEIKELSKGLVVHYKLNEPYGMTNLIDEPHLISYNNHGSNLVVFAEYPGEYYMGQRVRRFTYTIQSQSVADSFKTSYFSQGTMTSNKSYLGVQNSTTPYVYWIYYRPQTSGLTAGGTASNVGEWVEVPREYVGDGWWRVGQKRTTHTNPSTSDWIYTAIKWPYAGVGSSCTIDFAEAGFLISGTTTIPDNFIAGSNVVHDCSGYRNNGTASTVMTTVANSPRYDAALDFSSSKYIKIGRNGMIRENITVSLWAYMATWSDIGGRFASCTESGGWNFEWGSGKLRFACYAGGYALPTDPTTMANYPPGWHHFVGVFDGNNKKAYFYRDGVMMGSATTSSNVITYHANNGIFIGAEAGGNQTSAAGNYFNNPISDFRIYGTALSAEDVLELYQTKASVDNKGNFYCGEIKES